MNTPRMTMASSMLIAAQSCALSFATARLKIIAFPLLYFSELRADEKVAKEGAQS
jgi:hypothetical protein